MRSVYRLVCWQAHHIPPTERTEVAGFAVPGDNAALRAAVLDRLNQSPAYRKLFGKSFPEVRDGAPITFAMFGQAIAEFEFTLTFANAPIDRFARGERDALTEDEKHGALLFFGAARCVACHSVAGASNEMFSDIRHLRGPYRSRSAGDLGARSGRRSASPAALGNCWRVSSAPGVRAWVYDTAAPGCARSAASRCWSAARAGAARAASAFGGHGRRS